MPDKKAEVDKSILSWDIFYGEPATVLKRKIDVAFFLSFGVWTSLLVLALPFDPWAVVAASASAKVGRRMQQANWRFHSKQMNLVEFIIRSP